MDFSKYVSLLSTRAIFFARADTFADPYEGAKGLRERKAAWDAHYLDFFRNALRTAPVEDPAHRLSDEEIDARAPQFLTDLEAAGTQSRTSTFVSCWHENDGESEAMWRLYAASFSNAIAVRTTAARLYSALGRNPDIPIGRVKYIDMRRSFAGPNDAFWRKRFSFRHENEVRALVRDHICTAPGRAISCDLSTLIDAVFVSPEAPSWFSALVNEVTSKYGLDIQVSPSSLADPHFF